ncbi:hypothetical protein QYM36_012701 [Artemia franciscana]|uniref:Uncharacterized protein n=1 Tax=Artemia franciscana TaxID=6661 RepID=A0AA88HMN2_ARTSF|nr:hypothetical protein QYM36_012701 [Artemia franciscana]
MKTILNTRKRFGTLPNLYLSGCLAEYVNKAKILDMAGPKRGRGGKASAQAPEKVEGEPEIKVGKSEEDVKEETPKEEQISSETDQGEKEANAEEKPAAQEKAEEKKPVAKGKGKKGGKVEEPAVEEKTTEEEEPADAKTEETKEGKKANGSAEEKKGKGRAKKGKVEKARPAPARASERNRGKAAVQYCPKGSKRGAFEVTLETNGSNYLLWSGLTKGPPRRLKFPESEFIIGEFKKYL